MKAAGRRASKSEYSLRLFLLAVMLALVTAVQIAAEPISGSAREALAAALRGTQVSAVVVDLNRGAVVATYGEARRAAAGSTLKPLLLEYALEHGMISPEVTVLCHRNLHIGSRTLPCTHPANEDVFSAETALAESCNTYFAALSRRFSEQSLDQALRQSGIQHSAPAAPSPDEIALTVLGLRGVSISPIELALAYRRLALSIPGDGPVAHGLAGSVKYGMANGASVPGMTILGKTGTATNPGETWTHGWFAGVLPDELVVVVLVPHGDGGTAARLARRFFIGLERDRSVR